MKSFSELSFEVLISLIGIGIIFLLVMAYLIQNLNKSEKRRKESEEKFEQLEGKINKLELETQESKLSPHLFKNILNSIPCVSNLFCAG